MQHNDEQYATYKNIDFASAIPTNKSYNFIIVDLGSYINKPLWNKASVKILCGCFDFIEDKSMKTAYQNLQPDAVIGSFVPEAEQPAISEAYSGNNTKVLFSNYSPEFLFAATDSNDKLYSGIMEVYSEFEKLKQIKEIEEAEI